MYLNQSKCIKISRRVSRISQNVFQNHLNVSKQSKCIQNPSKCIPKSSRSSLGHFNVQLRSIFGLILVHFISGLPILSVFSGQVQIKNKDTSKMFISSLCLLHIFLPQSCNSRLTQPFFQATFTVKIVMANTWHRIVKSVARKSLG